MSKFIGFTKTKSIKAHLCVYNTTPMPATSPSDPFPFSGPFSSLENFKLTWNRGGADLTPATGAAQAFILSAHILLSGCGTFPHKLVVHDCHLLVFSLSSAQVRVFALILHLTPPGLGSLNPQFPTLEPPFPWA